MKNRNRSTINWIAAALVALLLIGLPFAFLSFQAAWSQTGVNTQGGTGSLGQPEEIRQLQGEQLRLFVEEQGPVSDALRKSLKGELERSGLFSEVVAVDDYDKQMPTPALVVRIPKADTTYTPVFARASLRVEFFYSSNGDLSFIDRGNFVFQRAEGAPAAVQSRQTLDTTDQTIGIISGPGYMNHLADAMAKAMHDRLQTILSPA